MENAYLEDLEIGFIVLPSACYLNDVVSISDCTATNNMMINEK
jgi:hypothetical protein